MAVLQIASSYIVDGNANCENPFASLTHSGVTLTMHTKLICFTNCLDIFQFSMLSPKVRVTATRKGGFIKVKAEGSRRSMGFSVQSSTVGSSGREMRTG